jgi:hypothetical protein
VVLNRGRRRVWVEVIGVQSLANDRGIDDRLNRELPPLDRDQSTDLEVDPGTFQIGETIVGFAEVTAFDERVVSEPLRIVQPSV